MIDYSAILNSLSTNAVKLISLGGTINPYVGAVVALLITVALFWLNSKAKDQAHQSDVKQSGESISSTGKDQATADSVLESSDDFFNKNKDQPK